MKPNKPNAQEKRSTLETLHTLWVPMAVGAVLLVILAIVANLVWKDYSTALMESQTRQMELVVQSLADSIEFSLEEYLDRLDSAVAKVEANPDDKPTVAPSDTLRDIWLEDNDGSIVYRCYGITALSDVLITRSEGVSYWQYHRGDTHYLVLKKAAGKQSVCLVVDSTALYKQLVSDIRVGTNGYVMIKNANDMVVMHPESAQWGIQVVDGRQKLYAYKDLDLTSLSELLKAQRTQDSGIRDYYSYWWTDPSLPRVHKISAFRHLKVGDSFWIREQEVPDYWWDGTQALEQEGPKVDLSPYYTKDEINNIVNDINQKIEDKSTSIIFDTYIQMKSFVDDPTNADKLKEGTILLIREKNVPDYYYDGAGIVKMEADVEQCLYVTLANKPTESTISYTQDLEVTNFAPGAIARWVDADGNDVFYKLVEIVGGKAKWITLIDTKYGNVTLQSTYDKNYEIVNIVSGSRLQAINSEKNDIKFVNSATGNVTVVLNGTVSGGAKKLVSMLAVNEVVLPPGAAVSFTRNGDEFVLTELFGVTIFPDLADANREGEWVMSVGATGKPILMEVKEMRKWDESITKELTIDELNEKFPNVDIGFAVVCKTINKVYEMVNGYKEWVSYDINSIS